MTDSKYRSSWTGRRRDAVTLVEVLVVIAIVGVLSALTLQGVQSSRETARQLACRNNLRQIGLATQQFVGVKHHYPTGGWGWKWVADVQVHSKYGQPGGWIYQLLPYLEASVIHDIPWGGTVGGGGEPGGGRLEVEARIHRLLETPHAIFHCPSRPIARVVPFNAERIPVITNLATPPPRVALTDYVANGGTGLWPKASADGPTERTRAAIESHTWADLSQGDGAILLQNRISPAQVRTGTSNVIWAGEKYLGHANYDFDQVGGNDQSMYSGECTDIRRYVREGIIPDRYPMGSYTAFGTPHPMSMNAVRLDGSVNQLDVNMDMLVFFQMGSRIDLGW